jgi:hypothetical protein
MNDPIRDCNGRLIKKSNLQVSNLKERFLKVYNVLPASERKQPVCPLGPFVFTWLVIREVIDHDVVILMLEKLAELDII